MKNPNFFVETISSSVSVQSSTLTSSSIFDLTTTPSSASIVSSYPTSTMIGVHRNISFATCDIFQPCRNNGTCFNKNSISSTYNCKCPPDFGGDQCQIDNRLCKTDTCWNNGISIFFYSRINTISLLQVYAKKYLIKHSIALVQVKEVAIIVKQRSTIATMSNV